MKHLITIIAFFITSVSQASIDVLFHPYDNTMEEIAQHFLKANKKIDMALYNIDSKSNNPVIKALMSEVMQKKITSGQLVVRLIFEGYMSKGENRDKMQALEAMGVDVRYLGIGKKMHHKFATIDSNSSQPILITGSANWSMMSQRNYNENVLFFKNEPGVTLKFQSEFDLLWAQAKEIGVSKNYIFTQTQQNTLVEEGIQVEFNTKNFKVTDKGFRKSKSTSYVLTKKIVAAIDKAQHSIKIATTRIKLRPVYDALLRAAQRGVVIDIVVTQGEYLPLFVNKKMKNCEDIYQRTCSTSQNFAYFLTKKNYPGKDNVNVRVKYFDLRNDNLIVIAKQMHSKYMIVDESDVLTGSFNWSYSAEYNHFENLLKISYLHFDVLDAFVDDFELLWNNEREKYDHILTSIESNDLKKCRFSPMTLSFTEVDQLVKEARKVNVCQGYKKTAR